MGKYHANDLGSVVLGRPAPAPLSSRGGGGGGGHFKVWSASLRRIVLDTVRCGARQKPTVKSTTEELKPRTNADLTTLRLELSKHSTSITTNATPSGSDKLLDLLRLSEFSEKENEEEEAMWRKVETLEKLKTVVRSLQVSQDENCLVPVLEGAKKIRRLTKDDSEARTTLALLGAIPPLVALLDSPDLSSHIAALYALLNIGIGNDP